MIHIPEPRSRHVTMRIEFAAPFEPRTPLPASGKSRPRQPHASKLLCNLPRGPYSSLVVLLHYHMERSSAEVPASSCRSTNTLKLRQILASSAMVRQCRSTFGVQQTGRQYHWPLHKRSSSLCIFHRRQRPHERRPIDHLPAQPRMVYWGMCILTHSGTAAKLSYRTASAHEWLNVTPQRSEAHDRRI